jgi:Tfp pilus assembly protein PilO
MTKRTKTIIRVILGIVVAVDLGLAGINWQLADANRAPESELKALKRQHGLMAADIARAETIRGTLPQVELQCDNFFKQNFRPAASGYSSVVSDFGSLSRSAGLQTENLNFHQHDADKRGVTEVEISAVVDGDYSSVVRFINNLQHSDTFYVLDGLSLSPASVGSGPGGQLKLNLQLRTYFRT